MKKVRSGLARIVAMLSLAIVEPVSADPVDCGADTDEKILRRAEQKVVLLERMVGATAPVQRVLDSGRSDALTAIDAARESARQARRDLDAGCNTIAAETATEGLSQASRAFKLVRKPDARAEQDFEALHQRTTSFLQVLESQPVEARVIGADDIAGMRRQLSRAETMAIDGKYSGASALLKPVADRLERRLIAIFDQQTVYYEREFTSLEDEHAYLAEQYKGYMLLLQLVGQDKQPPYSGRERYRKLLLEALQLNEDAELLAATGNWESSLSTMREALVKCEQALRLIGVRY